MSGGIFSTSIFGEHYLDDTSKAALADLGIGPTAERPPRRRSRSAMSDTTLAEFFEQHADGDKFVARVTRDWPKIGPGGTRLEGYLHTYIGPITEEDIAAEYGGGEYRVELRGPDQVSSVLRVAIAGPTKTSQSERKAGSLLPLSWFSSGFYLPLNDLSEMLLSACDPITGSAPPREVARSVVGGWMTTVDVVDGRFTVSAFDDAAIEQHADHRMWSAPSPWRRLLRGFYDASDTDIYSAYVEHAALPDRSTIKEYVLMGISMARVACERESAREGERHKQDQGRWYLWLDDERDPKVVLAADNGEACLGERYKQYAAAGLSDAEWRWAKSAEQAMRFVEAYGHPRVMGLDHDLGPGETTMAFLRWMADNNYHVPQWYVHSANPVGRDNIEAFMRSWSKSAYPATEEDIAEDTRAALERAENLAASDDVDDVAAFESALTETDEPADDLDDEVAANETDDEKAWKV